MPPPPRGGTERSRRGRRALLPLVGCPGQLPEYAQAVAAKLHFGPARVPSRESPEAALEALLASRLPRLRDRLRGPLLDGTTTSPRPSASSPARRALSSPSTPPSRASWATPSGQEAEHGHRDARPFRRDRQGGRRRARRLPPRLPARAEARAGDRLGLRAARRAAPAPRGEGSRRPLRDRGDGTGASWLGRGRRRRPGLVVGGPLSRSFMDVGNEWVPGLLPRSPGSARCLEAAAPFDIHFSDIQFANRNETEHLPYGEGTLRAEPLAEALAAFARPATVISESPDPDSTPRSRRSWARRIAGWESTPSCSPHPPSG